MSFIIQLFLWTKVLEIREDVVALGDTFFLSFRLIFSSKTNQPLPTVLPSDFFGKKSYRGKAV